MSIQDLESAVSQLPNEELNAFARWFEEYLADKWDEQIEADAKAGKLDAFAKRVDADIDAGRFTPLFKK